LADWTWRGQALGFGGQDGQRRACGFGLSAAFGGVFREVWLRAAAHNAARACPVLAARARGTASLDGGDDKLQSEVKQVNVGHGDGHLAQRDHAGMEDAVQRVA
jgi:hypothetical protein